MRAFVLDSDVLLAAFRSDRGASRVLLQWARARRFELLLSVPLLLEYEAVLTRSENLAASGVDREDVGAVLNELASICRAVEFEIRTRPSLPDPDDEWFWKRQSTEWRMRSSRSTIGISSPRQQNGDALYCDLGTLFVSSLANTVIGDRRLRMRRSNFALRVPPSLLAEARKAAESEGVALNQLITLALAEKVSALRTQEYFEECARRANPEKVTRILARSGKGNPPVEGDELPEEFVAATAKKKNGRR